MGKTALDISNRFRKMFDLEPITVHTAIDHNNLIPVDDMAATPVISDGKLHIMPLPPVPVENLGAQPVHHHSLHRHHRLQKASFVKRLSHALMLLGPWKGRAVALVLGKRPFN